MAIDKLQDRQLELGMSNWFRPRPESAGPFNQVDLDAGIYYNLFSKTPFVVAAQTSPAFAVVSGPGQYRYDLLYLDTSGAAQILQGNEQAGPPVPFTQAPGQAAGPAIPADHFPIAYVLIIEDITVDIQSADITDIRAAYQSTLNMDAVNPADIALAAAPGSAEINARRDHVHQLGAPVLAQLASAYAKSQTCLWTPYSALANPGCLKWVLHKFQARAANDANFWFDINIGNAEVLALWPVDDGGTGNNIGLGWSDDTDVLRAAIIHGWLYVYIIGNPTTLATALVYSTSPPSIGPLLTNPGFAGYTVWRWVTCLEFVNDVTLTFVMPVPMRKMGHLVVKEQSTGNNNGGHGELLYWNASSTGAVSLAEHISPLAMAAFVNAGWLMDVADSISWKIGNTIGTAMGRQTMIQGISDAEKAIKWIAEWNVGVASPQRGHDGFWIPVDENRAFRMVLTLSVSAEAWMLLQVYIEHDIEELANINWAP